MSGILSRRIDHFFTDGVEKFRAMVDITLQRLLSELETGGNIRFEDGKPSDLWSEYFIFILLYKLGYYVRVVFIVGKYSSSIQ